MAVTFLKRSTLPAAVKGKVGTLSVGISNMGQVTLSSLATKAINGATHLALAFDNGKVMLFTPDAPIVAKAKLDTKDMIELRKAKKGGTVSFSGAAILRDANTFGTKLYDFKSSGNQTFAVTVDEKNKAVTFELPEGKMTPKPVVKRERKVKPASVKAEAGSTVAISEPATDELVLDVA